MKFPITREELQRFNYTLEMNQKRERDVDNKIEDILKRLCVDFEKSIQTSTPDKRYVWTDRNNKGHGVFTEIFDFLRYYNNGVGGSHDDNISLFEFKKKYLIEKIRKIFIGCDIIVDPLQTYIIIDWS
jgi:hypothetical protein